MTAAVGDNTKVERERRVQFSYYHQKDRDIAAKIRALNEEKKSNRQNAKAAGFTSAKLDHYLKAFLAEDQQKPVDKLRSERENLIWLGLIPDTLQGDLLTSDRVDQEQMIAAKGFHAGLNALDRVSGYDGGSSEDRHWLESYDLGRKEYDTVLPDIMARIQAEADKESPPADDEDDIPFGEAAE
ncbi:hypothetical protein [Rhizobium sp. Root1220]|uniref:hypothetical protein n=1 Tax=Rhizobium sp. Root1220 TaxID=1736432 RepID=UPI0006F53B41|nr:hypothetical protein [Rhizobium sp. Root1220]KQV83268.1 hypothetical protein ASC90_22005 [Rhizobium sp. Root1220]